MRTDLHNKIFNIKNQNDFLSTTLEVFDYQYNKNPVYQDFINSLGKKQDSVINISDIPFLPAEFFRNHKIVTGSYPVEMIFESSGTTGTSPGRHFVIDLWLYGESFLNAFQLFYGNPSDYIIAALLPSYTERENSSLIYMMDRLIKVSQHPLSGFYKAKTDNLIVTVKKAKKEKKKIFLLGVSFALLDLAEKYSPDLSGVIVMETGGMKGRRKEITRQELHTILKEKFNVPSIHSEYGMTELMSQAYSNGDGIFYCPPWMKVVIRDPQDPLFVYAETGKTGGVNIIDLANINSCSFIATGDLGKLHDDGGFEILGRFDNSEIRGCNLLAD
ncbi:MAG: acyl transferase [Bacteroidetes bacterium]|nr:MAG: acyl transferase [Bacteroidota bacterium]